MKRPLDHRARIARLLKRRTKENPDQVIRWSLHKPKAWKRRRESRAEDQAPSIKRPSLDDFGGRTVMHLPVAFFCELFNAIVSEQRLELRDRMLEYIRLYRTIAGDGKGHLAAGFKLNEDGTMEFDEKLYSEQIYRGKTETRFESAKELHKKLLDEIGMFAHMAEEQRLCSASLSDVQRRGQISAGRDVNIDAQKTLDNMRNLLKLLKSEG